VGSTAGFRETQRFGAWWVWLLVVVCAIGAWWPFLAQVVFDEPLGSEPAPDWLLWLLVVLFGVGLPALFAVMRLEVEVRADRIDVRYRPFMHRSISAADIAGAQARTYRPVREYGGWGIKGWSRTKVAYNVAGDRGVELRLRDGSTVMLGSQRPAELEAAVRAILPPTRPSPPSGAR